MNCCGYNNKNKKQTLKKCAYQTLREELTEMSVPEILELIHTTHDIVLLTRTFYLLGLYLLSEESGCDKIIKCKVLYDKILTVLKCGLQGKVCIALNLISALLFVGDEQGYSRRKTLHIYSQNMIKTSGCLAAMCDLFTNCMMQRACVRALCVSLCLSAGAAQAKCAHLVTQCIQRCRQDLSETYSLLQILLCNNDRNIQLFHESNGMAIFTRESLQHPGCLHLLNTLAENTSPQNIIMLNQSDIFEILQTLLSKYGSSSMVGKWALIILYSRQKAIETTALKKIGNTNNTAKDDTVPIYNQYEEHKNVFPCSHNETSQLFRNVYKEIMILQKKDYHNNYKQSDLNCYKDILVHGQDKDFRMNYKFTTKRTKDTHTHTTQDQKIYKDKSTSPPSPYLSRMITKKNDLSFSFLKKQNTYININTKLTRYNNKNILKSHLLEQTQVDFTEYSKIDHSMIRTNTKLEFNNANNTIDFKPPFVSTPKHRPRLTTLSSTSWSLKSLSFKRQDKLNRKVQKVYKSKDLIRKQLKEKKQNKSMSTKFFDLINGSCTTLVKSFTNIKNLFKPKISEEVANEETKNTVSTEINNDTCSYSFTNYMQKRDAYLQENNTILTKEFTEKSNSYCNTCNDTGVLRHKLANDKSLQKTIKKLKLGINLYGCNFKKISRTMWPRETYTTPSVLYNLYRKLIVK